MYGLSTGTKTVAVRGDSTVASSDNDYHVLMREKKMLITIFAFCSELMVTHQIFLRGFNDYIATIVSKIAN